MLTEIYSEHLEDLHQYALAIARDESEANDLLQETFLKALANGELLKILPAYKKKAWLFTTLKNHLIDARRKEKRILPLLNHTEFTAKANHKSQHDIEKALSYLPEALREIIIKKYWRGMNSKEIALALSIPAATVRHKIHTAIKIIRNNFSHDK